jgi:serine/threonine-protein kinase HipA
LVNKNFAAVFSENNGEYLLEYKDNYQGLPISLTLPVSKKIYEFNQFPSFFDGLLPEGVMLEMILKKCKIDKSDSFKLLGVVGDDFIGNITVENIDE